MGKTRTGSQHGFFSDEEEECPRAPRQRYIDPKPRPLQLHEWEFSDEDVEMEDERR